MKIQQLDAKTASKQDTYTICVLKPKKIPKERIKQGNNPRDGNFPHQTLMRRRKLGWVRMGARARILRGLGRRSRALMG